MVGDWIDLVLARVPKAVILVIPTFIDMCTTEEIKEKCENILSMVHLRVQEIRRENEKDVKGSRTLVEEIPVLPSSFLFSENGETKVCLSCRVRSPFGKNTKR